MNQRDDVVSQIASRIDIVDLISEYIPLKKTGANFKACCPFHSERTPSFVVSPEKQIFHCFGCHAGGDIFSFVMKHDSLNFPEALEYLGNKCGVDTSHRKMQPEEKKKRDSYKAIYQAAAQFYHHILLKSQEADHVRKYLHRRDFDMGVITKFQLGYAPQRESLVAFLKNKGFDVQEVLDAQLARKREDGKVIDLFWKRLMIPIQNYLGEVTAFGGRVLDDSLPKYINSPESKYFKKREELYSFHVAKKNIDPELGVIFVEGYFDLIRLQDKGFLNAVATLGTSLTSEHAKKLKRYTEVVTFIFDNDKAGIQAALRGIDVAVEEGLFVKVLTIPGSKDPDDYLRENDVASFRVLLEGAKDFFRYKLDLLLGRYDKASPMGLAHISQSMLQLIQKLPNRILYEKYLQQLGLELNVSQQSLITELNKLNKKNIRQIQQQTQEPQTVTVKKIDESELAILSVLLRLPDWQERLKQNDIEISDFQDPVIQEVLALLNKLDEDGLALNLKELSSYSLSEEARLTITQLTIGNDSQFDEFFIKARFKEFKIRLNQRKIQDLKEKIKRGEEGDENIDPQLLQELTLLKKKTSDLRK